MCLTLHLCNHPQTWQACKEIVTVNLPLDLGVEYVRQKLEESLDEQYYALQFLKKRVVCGSKNGFLSPSVQIIFVFQKRNETIGTYSR